MSKASEAAGGIRRASALIADAVENNQWDPLTVLPVMQSLVLDLAYARDALVQRARAEGASWADVGRALGQTKQAAQQRFGG